MMRRRPPVNTNSPSVLMQRAWTNMRQPRFRTAVLGFVLLYILGLIYLTFRTSPNNTATDTDPAELEQQSTRVPKLVKIAPTKSPVDDEFGKRKIIPVDPQDIPGLPGDDPDSEQSEENMLDVKASYESVLRFLKYWEYAEQIDYPKPIDWPGQKDWDETNRYITFEPDQGGFNNIRLQFETVVVLAHMLNRTLVLPPKQHYYLIGKDQTVEAFYEIEPLREVMPVLSMEEFLQRTRIENVVDKEDWGAIKKYLRTTEGIWKPQYLMYDDMIAIPSLDACKRNTHDSTTVYYPSYEKFKAFRKEKEFPDLALTAQIAHVISDQANNYRLFGLWYPFFYFEDPAWHYYFMGLIRSKFHYRTFLYQVGAQIISTIVGSHGRYAAIHVRRGDFQYKQTRLDADVILTNIAPLLDNAQKATPFSSLYILTDERDLSFFQPFYAKFGQHKVKFLHDYQDILEKFEVEKGYYGMIEQIIAAGAEIFIGTELSTFSSHVTRLREHLNPEFVSNKEIYFTTRQYKGQFPDDNWESASTWMNDGTPNWPHAVYFREFYRFLREHGPP